ncbi:MAG: reductive dehalogenase [Methanomassiliicoccales archaeon]|nr:MAG: reductive dehalogenase [Methanomassiliicoccales archaeon]
MTSEFTPYQIDPATYKRFDQRNICFSRPKWDKSFIAYGRRIYQNAPHRIAQGLEGYSKEQFAALTASWHIHDLVPRVEASQVILPKEDTSETDFPSETSPEQNSTFIKKFVNDLGAPVVGTTKVNKNWTYSLDVMGEPVEIDQLTNAVVFAVPMDQERLKESPNFIASTAVGVAYSKCRFIAQSLSEYISQMGHIALPAVNETGLSVPLAIDAGLGEFGRNGLLINDKYGMAVRIAKVFTDMPLAQDSPMDLGVRRFCTKCKKCAERCPVNAISHEDQPDGKVFSVSNNPGALKWYVHVDKCYRFWTYNGSDCSNCVTNCPFTKPNTWSHRMARGIVKRTGALNGLLLRIDNWL